MLPLLSIVTHNWLATIALVIALIGTASSTVFLGLVVVAAVRYQRRTVSAKTVSDDSSLPGVTLLKPVHGMEPRLFENLESFFKQDYPNFEILIGARDVHNGALQVAQKVREKYPNVVSRVVLSGPPSWPNAKVFSLDKMVRESDNSFFVITDSDVVVEPDFLRRVIPPLLNPKTGLVTCLYRGIPAGDLWSLLEALGMSVELPSGVLVADMMEGMRFALGAVMAVRKDALEKIGGIAATADFYSDDFVLGNEVWKAGYVVELSQPGIGHVLMPRSWKDSLGDQLRWMKSTRYSRPLGHIGTGLTYAMPFGLLGLWAGFAIGIPLLGVSVFAATFFNRVLQSVMVGGLILRDPQAVKYCWLYPVRDLLGFLTWAGSFTSRQFHWRGELYKFGRGGRITPQHRPAESAVGEQL
ncbi:MAG TPA: glycosyltransferase [Terriglobales bacterium]|jgi:ceramide glucosyltransferase|nr:glycosyltransferase [Terriglobales bacterium]